MKTGRAAALVRVLGCAVGLVPSYGTDEALVDAFALGLIYMVARGGQVRPVPAAWVDVLLHDETRAGGQGLGRAVAVAVLEALAAQPAVPEVVHAVQIAAGKRSGRIRPRVLHQARRLKLLEPTDPPRLTRAAVQCVQAVVDDRRTSVLAAVGEVVEGAYELAAWDRAQNASFSRRALARTTPGLEKPHRR